MLRRFSIGCLLLAWFCANGALSHTAQVFAWGQLLVSFSHHLTTTKAAVNTCDTEHTCAICQAIEHAKEDARDHPIPSENINQQKLVLACQSVPTVVFSIEVHAWQPNGDLFAPPRTEPVPMQPPRSGC